MLETRADIKLMRGVTELVRSDNDAEMTAKVAHNRLLQVGEKTLFIEQAALGRMATAKSSMENYAMSF